MTRVLGAVLVGGASSRFGSDKAAALWGAATLAEHAAAAIAPFVERVVRVGDDAIPDVPRSGLGPLGGIAAALDHAERHGFASVVTIACDMPRLPGGLIEALLRRSPAYCADAPVLGHWPASFAAELIARLAQSTPPSRTCSGAHGSARTTAVALADEWMPGPARRDGEGTRRHLRNGALSLRRWVTAIGALPIASPAPIANINTPADLLTL